MTARSFFIPQGKIFLHRLWVGGERLTEAVQVGLVDDGCSRVYPFRQWIGRGGAPVFKFVDGVVMEVVNEFQAVIAHLIWFLRNRGSNYAAFDPIERGRILVERYDGNFPLEVEAVE